MSSLRLTTQLQQKMVLTPQLRQRIEMLQMTTMELAELIEQEMVSNPILEEVMPGDEVQEISENILDQNADGVENGFENGSVEAVDSVVDPSIASLDTAEAFQVSEVSLNGSTSDADGDDETPREPDAFDEIDFGREFQDYLDPGYRTQEIEYKEDAPSFEQFLTRAPSLAEHLNWQLHMTNVAEELVPICECVIGNLAVDGRLNARHGEV